VTQTDFILGKKIIMTTGNNINLFKDYKKHLGIKYKKLLKDKYNYQPEQTKKLDNIFTVDHPDRRVVMFQIPPAPPGLPVGCQVYFYGRYGSAKNIAG